MLRSTALIGRPSGKLIQALLTIAARLKHRTAMTQLTGTLAELGPGCSYSSRQLATAADVLDSLDQRGVPLESELLKKLGRMLDDARPRAIDFLLPPEERAVCIRLLGREPHKLAK